MSNSFVGVTIAGVGAHSSGRRHAEAGDYVTGIELLSAAANTAHDEASRQSAVADLINAYLHSSDIGSAKSLAGAELERLRMRRISGLVLFIALNIVASMVLSKSRLKSIALGSIERLLRMRGGIEPSWKLLHSIQFAYHWFDIQLCVALSLIKLARASDSREETLSSLWCGYAASYWGRTWIGIRLLRAGLRKAHRDHRDLLPEGYTFLAIAYHMDGDVCRALRCHALMDKLFPDAQLFWRVLTLTTRTNLLLSNGLLTDSLDAFERAYASAASLDRSRHHVQIFGAKAVLLVLRGQRESGLALLERAREAAVKNSNPLDFSHYHRLAAMIMAHLGDLSTCLHHVALGRRFLQEYGGALMYEHDLLFLEVLARRSLATDWSTRFIARQRLRALTVGFLSRGQRTRNLAAKIRDHVGKAFDHVNGMLADVTEISRGHRGVEAEPQSLRVLLRAGLAQVFRYEAHGSLQLRYALAHRGLIGVDALKVQRVFANILENARQAMCGKGTIVVSSCDLSPNLVEVTIANDGAPVAKGDVPHLFEAFFTKGKRGGTGLGLAICQKVIQDHGGLIRCESDPDAGTKFIFTLPSLPGSVDLDADPLPNSSDEIRRSFERTLKSDGMVGSLGDQLEVKRRAMVRARVCSLGRPLEVLVVDDEALYVDGIKGQLESFPDIVGHVHLRTASSVDEARAALGVASVDLVICDVDLGDSILCGLDLVQDIKKSQGCTEICMHSNRSSAEDYRRSVEAGADAFLPKPMSASHLLGLLAGPGFEG